MDNIKRQENMRPRWSLSGNLQESNSPWSIVLPSYQIEILRDRADLFLKYI